MVVAGWKGKSAVGLDLIYDTLATPSLDEESAEYGLLAEAVTHPADFSSVTYRLRPEAKWHDGRPATAEDVIFSFEAFKKNNPQLSAYYRRVISAEATGEREITFTFDSPGNRELPQTVGQLTVLPKHWWEASAPQRRDITAVEDKRVIRAEFPIRNMGIMQAFAFNIRRRKFDKSQLRRALNFAFDFEQMNNEIFYGQYKRIASYFAGTELASSGQPEGRELEILETVRGQVPAEVFTHPYWNPVGGNSRAARSNLRQAARLLEAAGFSVSNFKLVDNETGEPLAIEFLLANPSYERVVMFYKQSLTRLGIDVTVRVVDDVQYQNRLRHWDFDVAVQTWPETLSPGNEQHDYWGSQAAGTPGSGNIIGIANKAIDSLINRVVFAKDRAELVAATRALDRVLLWNHYVVPQWMYGKVRTARWDRFGKPDQMPAYGLSAFPTIWWWDAQRATGTASRS